MVHQLLTSFGDSDGEGQLGAAMEALKTEKPQWFATPPCLAVTLRPAVTNSDGALVVGMPNGRIEELRVS